MSADAATELSAERVLQIYVACLLGGSEKVSGIRVGCCIYNAAFHPERLAKHKAEIEAVLDELPDRFKKIAGFGGWPFLDAYYDKHGNQWTDLHLRVGQLFLLGLAIGKIEFVQPRKHPTLPGEMPCYVIH